MDGARRMIRGRGRREKDSLIGWIALEVLGQAAFFGLIVSRSSSPISTSSSYLPVRARSFPPINQDLPSLQLHPPGKRSRNTTFPRSRSPNDFDPLAGTDCEAHVLEREWQVGPVSKGYILKRDFAGARSVCAGTLTMFQVSQMLPPSLPASIFVFAVLTVVAGMCVGWAWGCAAMAAALQARSQTLLARQVQTAEAG
jgi:hypothetical protein